MGYAVRPRSSGISFGGIVPPGVKWLLILNIGLFVLRFLLTILTRGSDYGPGADPFYYLGLTPRMVLSVYGVYQLFTYMFIHSLGFTHVLFNMLALWMFGSDIERTWGTRRFLQYYFLCGIAAGVCVVIGNMIYGTLNTWTIGASGAVYGILLAFGMMFPNATVLFSFLFPIKAKYFVMIIGAITFLSTVGDAGSGVSHVAHLGGLVFGYLYLRSGMGRFDLLGPLRGQFYSWRHQYSNWKLRRAHRKFQVYLGKRDTDRDRRTH